MSDSKAKLTKQALDSEAEKYWEDYYKDSGYGKLWTREIPKRVQAELTKQAKTAGAVSTANESPKPSITPIATVITDHGVVLEGLATYGQGPSAKSRVFVADFDHEGAVLAFDSVSA